MRKLRSSLPIAVLTLGLLALSSLPLSAAAVRPIQPVAVVLQSGDDALQTPGDGTTQTNLDGIDIPGACGTSNGYFSGDVTMKGVKINSALGKADTIVRRLSSTPALAVGQNATVPLQIVALHLKSTNILTVNCEAGGTRSFRLHAWLSPNGQSVGTMTLFRNSADGGDFDSVLYVTPQLEFRATDGSGDKFFVDCGVSPECGEIIFDGMGSEWTLIGGPRGFDPAAEGLVKVSAGVPFDSDGDGVNDGVTIAGGNVQVGFDSDFWLAARIAELKRLNNPNGCDEHQTNPAEEDDTEPPDEVEEEPTQTVEG